MSDNEGGSRTLGACLFLIGFLGLAANIYIGSRFGWSLADDVIDRSVVAAIHGVASAAEAALTMAGAFMWAWGKGWRGRAILAVAVAIIFTAYGFLSAYGFFSGRVAVTTAQKAAVKTDEKFLSWLQSQTVNSDIARAERKTMLAEAKAANEGIKKTLGNVKDQQASAVAEWFGQDPASAQRWLVASTSAISYLAQFSGFWFGAMTWARRRKRESDAKISSTPEGSGGKVKSEPATIAPRDEKVIPLRAEPAPLQAAPEPLPPKVSSEPARVSRPAPSVSLTLEPKYASVEDYLAKHPSATSQKVIADALKVSEAKVSRDIKRLKGRGKVKADRNGRSNSITFTPRRNGGLHLHA